MRLMAWMKLVANERVFTGIISSEDAAPLVGRLVIFVVADWAGDKQTRISYSRNLGDLPSLWEHSWKGCFKKSSREECEECTPSIFAFCCL